MLYLSLSTQPSFWQCGPHRHTQARVLIELEKTDLQLSFLNISFVGYLLIFKGECLFKPNPQLHLVGNTEFSFEFSLPSMTQTVNYPQTKNCIHQKFTQLFLFSSISSCLENHHFSSLPMSSPSCLHFVWGLRLMSARSLVLQELTWPCCLNSFLNYNPIKT